MEEKNQNTFCFVILRMEKETVFRQRERYYSAYLSHFITANNSVSVSFFVTWVHVIFGFIMGVADPVKPK